VKTFRRILLSDPSGSKKSNEIDTSIIMARTVAQWKVMRQREKSKSSPQGKNPAMTKERIQNLNKIGSVCSIQVDDWRPQGKNPAMTKERIQKLKKIGSVCSIPVQVDDWNPRLKELEKFQKENGHCCVPGLHTKDSDTYPLACWVARQRKEYRQRRGDMKNRFIITEERIHKLNDIGFEWSATAVEWHERFEQLKAFQKEHGHCRVPGRKEKNSSTHQLSTWVSNQRAQYMLLQQGKGSHMKEARIHKLNDIGFEWSLLTEAVVILSWHERFEQMKAFQKEHGHCRVTGARYKHSATHQLSTWVKNQRAQYKLLQRGKESYLKEEKIEMLNAIGFEWSVRSCTLA
jgi:hypothetical protein